LKTMLKNPLVKKALPAARKLALADGVTIKVPNVLKDDFIEVKTLDFLQRALRTKTLGAPSTSTVAFGKLRQRVLPVIDSRVPGFREIRTRYADGKAAQEALELGEKFSLRLGANQRQLIAKFDKMDKPQQELFRLGLARALKDQIGNAAGPGTNVARKLVMRTSEQKWTT
ncbi:MAG: hypothetical protein GY798_23805, partial [Hyphomicrobiales bacterium]|nr:hypothetical protein [Hyphomicrobiales bacterium]